MPFYNTSELKPGTKIIQDNEPCNVIDNEFVKPGKGQAFNRIKLRKLISGKIIEKTFKSSDSVEAADIVERHLTYIYNDGVLWYFMDNKNYEQLEADQTAIKNSILWLIEQNICTLMLWNGRPISVTPPNFVELVVVDTDPGLKGDTVSGGGKPAKLTTGAVVRVPLFIQNGDLIKVDTRTGEYVSRAKSGGMI